MSAAAGASMHLRDAAMDALFVTPLEENITQLISTQLDTWKWRLEQLAGFFADLAGVEETRAQRSLTCRKTNDDELLSKCDEWLTASRHEALAFVSFHDEELRPRLEALQERITALTGRWTRAREAGHCASVEHIAAIVRHLQALLDHFTRPRNKTNRATHGDPWLHEATVRHHAALFLRAQDAHLSELLLLFLEMETIDGDLTRQTRALVSDCLVRLRTSHETAARTITRLVGGRGNGSIPAPAGGIEDWGREDTTPPREQTQWAALLARHHLDYEWTLGAPPLDGFLFTLFNHIKSVLAQRSVHCETDNQSIAAVAVSVDATDRLPRLTFSPRSSPSTKTGFLMHSASGILSRTWQTVFCIMQRPSGFLHVYRAAHLCDTSSLGKSRRTRRHSVASDSRTDDHHLGVGQLHIPVPGTTYSAVSLQDMNILTLQFLHAPHNPASLNPLLLTPTMSLPMDSALATDPGHCAFSVRAGGDKLLFRAFCQEDMVDWVIAINDSVTALNSPQSSPLLTANEKGASDKHASDKHASDKHAPGQHAPIHRDAATESIPAQSPVELDNPWT